MPIYDDGQSLWEQRRDAEEALDAANDAALAARTAAAISPYSSTSGQNRLYYWMTESSGATLSLNDELQFNARGSKEWQCIAKVNLSGATTGITYSLALSGTNTGYNVNGHWRVLYGTSASTYSVWTGQTLDFVSDSNVTGVHVYGYFDPWPNAPTGIEIGTIGVYIQSDSQYKIVPFNSYIQWYLVDAAHATGGTS